MCQETNRVIKILPIKPGTLDVIDMKYDHILLGYFDSGGRFLMFPYAAENMNNPNFWYEYFLQYASIRDDASKRPSIDMCLLHSLPEEAFYPKGERLLHRELPDVAGAPAHRVVAYCKLDS